MQSKNTFDSTALEACEIFLEDQSRTMLQPLFHRVTLQHTLNASGEVTAPSLFFHYERPEGLVPGDYTLMKNLHLFMGRRFPGHRCFIQSRPKGGSFCFYYGDNVTKHILG
jgi:hypothetical protein